MKTLLITFINLFLYMPKAFAHGAEEGVSEVTNLAEAEWIGPIIAILIIAIAISIARKQKKEKSTINNIQHD